MLALLIGTTLASAALAVSTRAEYVERTEPICESATLANKGVLRGVDKMIRRGELKPAGRRFLHAARAFGKAVRRIATVPRPPADESRLSRWLAYAESGQGLLRQLGRVLEKERRSRVDGLANQLLKNTKRANAIVVGFDFEYCRLNPARFV